MSEWVLSTTFGEGWEKLSNELKIEGLMALRLNDLERLSTIPELRKFAQQALKQKVHEIFRRFHLSPSKTLRMMRRTRTVLSGSAALKLIDGAEWENDDLDFYCGVEDLEEVVPSFEKRGYSVQETDESEETYVPDTPPGSGEMTAVIPANSCIEKVLTLKNEEKGLKINIIQSRSTSSVAPIHFFHSTIVMNYISSDSVVCAYPMLTLDGRGLMNVQTMPPLHGVQREVQGVVKYQARGYTFVQGRDEDPTVDPAHGEGYRTWSDEHTLRMTFRGRKKVTGAGDEQVMGWRVSYRHYYPDGRGFYEIPAHCVVKEGGEEVTYANWAGCNFLRHSQTLTPFL